MSTTLVLGGAAAGKSSFALRSAERWEGPLVFVATAEELDEEMATRIERHRAERSDRWRTIEEPLEVVPTLDRIPDDAAVVVDCMTLWVSNLLAAGHTDHGVLDRAAALVERMSERTGPTFVISNEVGLGLVPTTSLGRRYRDLLGCVNRSLADGSDDVIFMIAGRIVPLVPP